ncbi:hypothetical protein [Streptomyces sp. NPDC005890]
MLVEKIICNTSWEFTLQGTDDEEFPCLRAEGAQSAGDAGL